MTTLTDRTQTALVVIDVQHGVVTGAHERDAVVANVAALVDEAALERIFSRWVLSDAPGVDRPQHYPTLILAGRQDSSVGWAGAGDLVDVYPRASFAVVDGAGHALLHEQPEVVAALLRHWIARCRDEAAG